MRKDKHKFFGNLFKKKTDLGQIPLGVYQTDTDSGQEITHSGELTLMDFFLDAVSYRVELPVTQMLYYSSMESGYPLCPRCDTAIEREYMQYCDRCGQKLGWDSWEDAEVIDSFLRSGRRKNVTFFTFRTYSNKGVVENEQDGSWKKDSGGSSE